MAAVRDMINANEVFTKLASNPNLYVTTSFKLLPIVEFVTAEVAAYLGEKEQIVAEDTSIDEKEKKLNDYLDKLVTLPGIEIDVKTLRGCGLTLVDIQHIRWWLVDEEAEML